MSADLGRTVIDGFGDQWARLDQSELAGSELDEVARQYFAVFPWDSLPTDPEGFDLGCGSGRWARFVAPRVGLLHCVEPAKQALEVARRNLADFPNVRLHHAGADDIPLPEDSQDFGYCLGVLHHVEDTEGMLRNAVTRCRRGAPFLVYLYYRFDNKPKWYQLLWKASDTVRAAVASLPVAPRYAVSQLLAATVYYPLARAARVAERLGADVSNFPLTAYRDRSYYVMRTDARDRFGTRLEKRFTRAEIERLMRNAGLDEIKFSADVPFWCAVGRRVR